jgi:hypothetical protein
MIDEIKNWFKRRKESKELLHLILKDLIKLDHSKWFHPLIKHKDCHGYGFTDKGPDDLVDNLFIVCHPNLSYQFYDGPFSAYPIRDDIDVSKLTKKDCRILTTKFRDMTYVYNTKRIKRKA